MRQGCPSSGARGATGSRPAGTRPTGSVLADIRGTFGARFGISLPSRMHWPVGAARPPVSGGRSDRQDRLDQVPSGRLFFLVSQKGQAHLDLIGQGFLGQARVEAELVAFD